jgi:hypothetical protein
MPPHSSTDYLAKAGALRARRLADMPPAPAPTSPNQDAPEHAPSKAPTVPAVKATRKHALITTPDRVAELAASLRGVGRVGLDLETTGLDPRRDRVRLLALATEQGTWIVDCFEVDPRPLFPILAEKELVIHNALFDLGMLAEMGFELGEGGGVIDTMLLSQLLEGLRPKNQEV